MEKPSPLTLAPHDFANIKANVKVASTENGIIFGNIGKHLVLCRTIGESWKSKSSFCSCKRFQSKYYFDSAVFKTLSALLKRCLLFELEEVQVWISFKLLQSISYFSVCAGLFVFSVYDVSGAASDRNCVVLSDIHIDIMDYIQPASCTDAEFRQMWAEFEWENKVSSPSVSKDLCLNYSVLKKT